MNHNEYLPFRSEIKEVIRHNGHRIHIPHGLSWRRKTGSVFEVSIPKFRGSAYFCQRHPEDSVDLTIRR